MPKETEKTRENTGKNKIKEIRKSVNCTQRDFALKFHIPLRTIQKWECFQARPPEYIPDMMERIISLENQIDILTNKGKED